MSSSDSWRSPSSVDDSDKDPSFEPQRKRNRQAGFAKKKPAAARRVANRRTMNARAGATRTSSSSSEEDACDHQPGTSMQATMEKSLREKMDALRGKKKTMRIRTTFQTEIDREPFRHGVAEMPVDFQWTDKEPQGRPDFFQPLKKPGHTFRGDELASEIFLAFYEPALELLLKGVNETGIELVAAGKIKKFKPVDYEELLRFHSILLYTQAVKISRFDAYWKKGSILYQDFVAKQMTFSRFKQLKRAIRCYVPSEVEETGKSDPKSNNYDPMFKVTPLQNILLNSFRKHRFPAREVTIDEQMVKFKVNPFFYGLKK